MGVQGRGSRACLVTTLLLVTAVAGCGSPGSPTTTPTLITFSDGAGFSTADVRDVQDQVVRFDSAMKLTWAASGAQFSNWPVNGHFLGPAQIYQVRFGTQQGQRRAYFTETARPTICDIEIVNGQLMVFPTNTPVP